MAERFGRLAKDVVASFQSGDAAERVQCLRHVGSEILVGMLPVIDWLERRQPPDKADLVKRRMDHLLGEATQCAAFRTPEYAGGTVATGTGTPSLGAARTAYLALEARAFAASLLSWADDIEAEDKQRSHVPPAVETQPPGPSAGSLQREDDRHPEAVQVDLEAEAIGLLFKRPEWDVKQIADSLGVERRTPYRWPKFRQAAEQVGKMKPRGPKACTLPRGYKTKDGGVEAYDEHNEDEDGDE
jgi:hypothetical protein